MHFLNSEGEHFGNRVVIFNNDEDDLQRIIAIQQDLQDTDQLHKLVLIALEGSTDPSLDSSRFLVENRESSWLNHMMWKGLFLKEDQDEYTYQQVRKFLDTGNQMVIENYEFVEDEPFYDYSGR